MHHSNPLADISENTQENDSAWGRASNYEKEDRPIRQVDEVILRGAVELVFFQAQSAQLVIAGENRSDLSRVKTSYSNRGRTLVIEQEGGGSVHISGSGYVVAGGDVYINGQRVSGGGESPQGRTVVGLSLPIAPDFQIEGSGDATLYDIAQGALQLSVQGSGDIVVAGEVGTLTVQVAGSGDVDAGDLLTRTANLQVAGSGDIEAYISERVKARVMGSGDIVVRGNPGERDHSVMGSGKVKFKPK